METDEDGTGAGIEEDKKEPGPQTGSPVKRREGLRLRPSGLQLIPVPISDTPMHLAGGARSRPPSPDLRPGSPPSVL